MLSRKSFLFVLALAVVPIAGCRNAAATRAEYQMGDKVPAGPLNYTVVEKVWRSQLGEGFQLRMPENRFLLITVSATNASTSEVSVPLLQLEGANGKVYGEVENGEGVEDWFGLLRTLAPSQTQQGRILFDVPLGTYRLRLSDGDSSSTRFTYVQIPLQIDEELSTTPAPGKL